MNTIIKTYFLMILATINLSLAQTNEKKLPDVKKPAELSSGEFEEGTLVSLTEDEVETFEVWAINLESLLYQSLKDSMNKPINERVEFIENEIKNIVRSSGKKKYQTLMRFALNRGMLLNKILLDESDINVRGTVENQIDILVKSIDIAREFYQSDLDFHMQVQSLDDPVQIQYAQFGLRFARKMFFAAINIFDASAQYRVLYKILEMLNWDIVQDSHSILYSEVIIDIYRLLESFDEMNVIDDQLNLKRVRQMIQLFKRAEVKIKAIQNDLKKRAEQEAKRKEEERRQKIKENAFMQREMFLNGTLNNGHTVTYQEYRYDTFNEEIMVSMVTKVTLINNGSGLKVMKNGVAHNATYDEETGVIEIEHPHYIIMKLKPDGGAYFDHGDKKVRQKYIISTIGKFGQSYSFDRFLMSSY